MRLKQQTTDQDLLAYANKFNVPINFIGFSDELLNRKIQPYSGSYIVNLGDNIRGGTHWTAFYLAPNRKAFYFDSFGVGPPEEVLKFMKTFISTPSKFAKGNIHINPFDIQNIKTGYCGQYVIDFLANIRENPTKNGFRDFLNKFDLFRIQKNKDVNIESDKS